LARPLPSLFDSRAALGTPVGKIFV